ncbi:MAG: hypothetical protein KDA32_10280 [Phycisphaerales bacterium]|nr:hypothetical protein [Phycisphaerales bacterium]
MKLEFRYDHAGRRVEKKVYAWDPTANSGSGDWESTPTTHLKFGYLGRELVMEYDGLNSDTPVRRYRWAFGQLWWIRKVGTRYVTLRDVSENITRLVRNNTANIDATYEYDVSGTRLVGTGLSRHAGLLEFAGDPIAEVRAAPGRCYDALPDFGPIDTTANYWPACAVWAFFLGLRAQ